MTVPVRVPLTEHPQFPVRLCRVGDPNRFCQVDGEKWTHAKVRLEFTARTVCRHCPILQPCREAGARREWGLWGGVAYRLEAGVTRSVDLLKEDT